MDLRRRFLDFAHREARGNSPCYEQRAADIADDDAVLALIALIAQLRTDEQQPNLILAAARVNGATAAPYGEFREQLIARWPAIAATAGSRRTQTNEAGRSATLLPVFARFPGPLSLIEAGASAGLCLFPDRLSYRYGDLAVDPLDGPSPVRLSCGVSGPAPIPARVPEVVHRAGVDLNPLDVSDPRDREWLEALVWPGQDDRHARLRAVAAIAAADPPHLVTGDLTDKIGELVTAAPSDSTVVVFHSAVLTYLPLPARQQFVATVRELPCHWVSQEGVGVLPDFADRLPREETTAARMVVAVDGEPVAWAGPHGQSLDWFGPA
ncbi:DUF2332 domain-containing protein [Nocardia neocaledoniensis]|uniref:DUF2332 domain-containing protein n=1 Tax=Nocardia neocaledoniensis TaxID=236511 RepID=UPI002454395F|nr:DUF2332 domain-containing protein [Nocardia neocaledoniensis]